MSALQARVRSNRRATPTTRVLVVDTGDRPLDYKPGQWARLGVDPHALRPYSIANPRTDDSTRLEFLVRTEGSGVELSAAGRGQPLFLDGPHGRFGLPDHWSEPHALFVAGGTGIAPLRAMLYAALAQAHHPRCTLLYSARARDEFAYLAELRALARSGRITLALTVTRATPRRWRGMTTRVDLALLSGVLERPQTHAFVCGPESFVADVRQALESLGVKKIRSEEQ